MRCHGESADRGEHMQKRLTLALLALALVVSGPACALTSEEARHLSPPELAHRVLGKGGDSVVTAAALSREIAATYAPWT